MKFVRIVILGIFFFASSAFAQGPGQQEITVYDPADAIHPFKLLSLVIRPPVALVNLFVKGGYWIFDSHPIRRAFNIDYQPTMNIDEDY